MFDNIDTSTLSGALNGGTQMLILGMLMVFSVLGIIFLALQIFHYACNLFMGKADKKEKAAEPTPAVVVKTNDEEIVAVIAAAIAAAENETPNARFRVVSFKRVS
ncbi:MAG: OadG family protein [Clostridia bacterium]|nr:OadG family protein [Clostridia bacterium]